MGEVLVEDYVAKLIYLEKRLGAKTKYTVFEPFGLNTGNIIAVQDTAKEIAEFIGLPGLIFVVAFTKQKEGVAGQIELRNGDTGVFVDISEEIAWSDAAVLAGLAHEIVHKHLQVHGVYPGVDPVHTGENEVLTDIATVFLGLGKLMLNGCEVAYKRFGVTKNLTCGYLDREQLAFVYRLVGAMRNIPQKDMLSGLSPPAAASLKACNSYWQAYFKPELRAPEYRRSLAETVKTSIGVLQDELERIARHLQFLKAEYVGEAERFLGARRASITSTMNGLKSATQGDIYDSCLLYLSNVELREKMTQMRNRVEQDLAAAMRMREKLNAITRLEKGIKSGVRRVQEVFSRGIQRMRRRRT